MLRHNPHTRITAKQALVHPYFSTEPKACRPNELKLLGGESHECFIKGEVKNCGSRAKALIASGGQSKSAFGAGFKAKKRPLGVVEDSLSPAKKVLY